MLTGYKFESIRTLHTEHVIAWEMLSTAKPHVNLEHYFRTMSFAQRKQHFFAQLRHAMSCNARRKYYLNATSELLLEEEFYTRLILETPRPEKLASKVLIEGIETFADFALARASAADYGQGYLWNK
ncbi:hypothetical protein [Enterobacter sp. RHBSTW-00175]|uniref:hypothetical protein n=1 Tax=Enterobacter sp. RHBSTW-00175 TaxID=2742639 RepID=UPI0015EA959E|nr:hypothetical protein [Enterobacter sp. RHBSTW-00175]HDR2755589.1 hypothetical protein [Enterobacter asburiae]QMR76548.1 hypothetical protein HV107_13465 [Enterobacter sp. RHBSTW-00175]HDR2786263.1 hypothetical protein [Enterobacter asburiae]HDR2802494.1 hypothetical protein [Enterobacter asburiae]HDR2807932.1 hypothetical protein [Enterobacter asburiae]